MSENKPLTFGEKAAGLSFNPSGDANVNSIKRGFADLIDEMNDLRNEAHAADNKERARMLSIAITEAQTAQMWAVKAITWTH